MNPGSASAASPLFQSHPTTGSVRSPRAACSIRAPAAFRPRASFYITRLISYARDRLLRVHRLSVRPPVSAALVFRRSCNVYVVRGAWPALLSAWRCRSRWWRRRLRRLSLRCRPRNRPVSLHPVRPPADLRASATGRALKPIKGATVLVEGTSLTATTDGDGRFSLPAVPPGEHHLIVAAAGLMPLRIDVTVGSTPPPPLDVLLDTEVHYTEVVSVSPTPATSSSPISPRRCSPGRSCPRSSSPRSAPH